MFTPKGLSAVAPRSAPFIPDVGKDVSVFLEGFKATNDTTKSALLAILAKFAETAEVTSAGSTPSDLTNNCKAMFVMDSAKNLVTLMNTGVAAGTNPTANDLIVERANTQVGVAVAWICDLVNASKKKELTGENVEGYYASLGRSDVKGSPIAFVINSAANFLPDSIKDASFRVHLTKSTWNDYHSSRSSTGTLLNKLRGDFIDLEIYKDGDKTDMAIKAASDAPYDLKLTRDIPDKIVGYASIFFEVGGIDVGHWYQGIKAQNEIPYARVMAIKSVFKKYLELKNKISSIDKADTVTDLVTTVGSDFW